ncbi:MAG: LiaI-LiaF-like domain-containing protein [Candidatus Acidiferrales bacterium]
MNCAVHSDVEATGFCRNCGKALCPACTREVRGALYCENCLAGLLGGASPYAAPPGGPIPAAEPADSDSKPSIACLLGLIPGLGAVYNGEYLKALIHVLVFGGLIAALNADWPNGGFYAVLGIGLGCFYCYMPLDAYRVARARKLGRPEPGLLAESGPRNNAPIGAFILIGLGVLFLMANFGWLQMEWFSKAWPIALIILGIWLAAKQMRHSS